MQSKQWKHHGLPTSKKFNSVHSAGKVMTSIVWGNQGVIMIDYLEQDNTINGAYSASELRRPGNRKREAWQTDLRCSALA